MARKHMKTYLTSPTVRKMGLKTTMRYHLPLIRKTTIKKLQINAGEVMEKREASYTVGGNVNWYNYYGKEYRGSSKETKSFHMIRNPTYGHMSCKNHISKIYKQPNIHCCTVYNSQDIKASSTFIDRKEDKGDVVHIDNRILLGHKMSEINPFAAACMDLEPVLLSKFRMRKTNIL